jgi:Fe-S-cluster containining protein
MIRSLSTPYASRHGVPVIATVDERIFTATYFAACMACTFCHDVCCSWGADVDAPNVARILAEGEPLEHFVGVPMAAWFRPEITVADAEFPGGVRTRTAVRDGGCVFLDRKGRGCKLHAFMLRQGRHYNEIKPMICALFGVTFDGGRLQPSDELADQSLRCTGPGLTAYRAARGDLAWYFGEVLVAELDAIERGMAPAA